MRRGRGKREGIPHHVGHRKRLRERLLKVGIDSLQDYEIIELLLTFSIPQRDGNPEPSDYDINLTKAMDLAAKSPGLILYDHIIITSNTYFSCKKHKLL